MNILITGIAGGLARYVARTLSKDGHTVTGVDYRDVAAVASELPGIGVHRANYHKTAIEDVFRKGPFDALLHLGRVGNLSERIEKRFDLNVVGSKKLFSLALSTGVKRLVVLSTFHVYGAHPLNHTPISEDEPLRAGPDFPQLADAIQLDSIAAEWAYRHPSVGTVVLRPTNVVGGAIENTMSRLLRLDRVPKLAGFNPMSQFIHYEDLARAVIAAAKGSERGVFNVAGPTAIPWATAIDVVGGKPLVVPSLLVSMYVRTLTSLPAYLVNFLKFPCVVSDAAFRQAFTWRPERSMRGTLEDVRRKSS
jgi:UDP-glucose 4-epimerase